MFEMIRYRPGRWVEVKSAKEILSTLDKNGRLAGMPFMPEMLQYCGRRYRIGRVAHKTCDTVRNYLARRVVNTVHLEGLRCDGASHSGCQAACLIFWKIDWLKPVESEEQPAPVTSPSADDLLARSQIEQTIHLVGDDAQLDPELWSCQATELRRFTHVLRWWDPRQYLEDLVYGNITVWQWVRFTTLAAFNTIARLFVPNIQFPRVRGQLQGKTPSETLDLKAGEWVRVRPKEEIMKTLNTESKNRGLWFDVEMLPHCEKKYKVLHRVDRIVDEKSGKLINLPGGCVLLDGTTCSGNYSRHRLFCPRAIHSYWREIWLRRIE